MSTETLGVYWGGFLLNSCAPLEVHLNRCSHNCVYCFANLADPDRRANTKQMFNLLADLWDDDGKGGYKRKTYAADLLRRGYAVTLSNHVDPLSGSNWAIASALIETLVSMNIPLNLMTRFGKKRFVDEFFELLEPVRETPIYCSVTTLNADIARKCEPGAPPPEERLEGIRRAIALGHPVNVGINPVIPGWIDDPDGMAKMLADMGVWGVCLGKIHLSKTQVSRMRDWEIDAMGDRAMSAAMRYRKDPELNELYEAVKSACKRYGMHVYTSQQGDYSEFFKHEKAAAKRNFPLMQDFVNHCHLTKQPGDYVYWEEFRDFFVPQLPKGEGGLRDHLNAMVVSAALNEFYIPQRMTYERLLWYVWQHTETIYCPANVDCFAWAGDPIDRKRNTWTSVLDGNGLPILVFKPEGTNGQAFTEEHNL